MINCYDSSDNRFVCEQVKINCLFADDVLRHYKEKRYGIKSCKPDMDEQYLWDLQQLFMYVLKTDLDSFDVNTYKNKLYIEEQLKELNAKGEIPDLVIQNLDICNISDILEKINSLK